MIKNGILKFIFTFLLFTAHGIFADTLKEAYIDVYLQENGDALIKTKWVFDASKGTENYIVIDNLGNSKIEDFKVFENGLPFVFVDKWKVKASREQKKHKYGILKNGSAYELCWGFGEFGLHTFDLEYKITGMVKQLKDAQTLNFQFINYDMLTPPRQATVIIHAQKPFKEEDVSMWAFGFEGEVGLSEGKILAKSTQILKTNNYLTVLLKFNDGYFTPTIVENISFEDVLSQSLEGSDYKKNTIQDLVAYGIAGILFVVVFGFISLLVIDAICTSIYASISLRRRKKSLKGQYFRDIPYDGDMEDIFYLIQELRLGKINDLVTAFFLKWIKEKRFITKKSEPISFFKKQSIEFQIDTSIETKMGIMEKEFFDIVKKAAGENNILESNEFKKWTKKNFSILAPFFNKIDALSKTNLEKDGYIIKKSIERLGFIQHDTHISTVKGVELENNIIKFYNYLMDYSLLNEKISPNVHLWDDYMIWAALFGITQEVEKEFAKLYPNYAKATNYSQSSVYVANQMSRSFYSSYRSGSSKSRSGGGGGRSSGGGGRGSSGGGRGGGSR